MANDLRQLSNKVARSQGSRVRKWLCGAAGLRRCDDKKGFTLVEMLVVATIIALLSAAGFVSYATANRNARNGKRKADLEQVRAALELYRSDNGSYADTNGAGSAANWQVMTATIGSYITSPNIADPRNIGVYVYTYSDDVAGDTAGRRYEICANLEPDPGTAYCLSNP